MDLTGLTAVTTQTQLKQWLTAHVQTPLTPKMTATDMSIILNKVIDILNKIGGVEFHFETVPGISINWQTDEIITGLTFFDFFSNKLPKPIVYTLDPNDSTKYIKKDFSLNLIRTGSGSGTIGMVEFDWATIETGFILF